MIYIIESVRQDKLRDVMNKLDRRGIPPSITETDSELNAKNTTTVGTTLSITEKIQQKHKDTTRRESQSTVLQHHNGQSNRKSAQG